MRGRRSFGPDIGVFDLKVYRADGGTDFPGYRRFCDFLTDPETRKIFNDDIEDEDGVIAYIRGSKPEPINSMRHVPVVLGDDIVLTYASREHGDMLGFKGFFYKDGRDLVWPLHDAIVNGPAPSREQAFRKIKVYSTLPKEKKARLLERFLSIGVVGAYPKGLMGENKDFCWAWPELSRDPSKARVVYYVAPHPRERLAASVLKVTVHPIKEFDYSLEPTIPQEALQKYRQKASEDGSLAIGVPTPACLGSSGKREESCVYKGQWSIYNPGPEGKVKEFSKRRLSISD